MPEDAPEHTLFIQFHKRFRAFKDSGQYRGRDTNTMHIRMTEQQWNTFDARYKDTQFAKYITQHGALQYNALGGLKVMICDNTSEAGLYVDDVMIGEPFEWQNTVTHQQT